MKYLTTTTTIILICNYCHGFVSQGTEKKSVKLVNTGNGKDVHMFDSKANKRFLEEKRAKVVLSSVNGNDDSANEEEIDVDLDERLTRIRIPRAPGIEWGTDLSFSFVYVRAMEPSGPAAISGIINVGDQLCELKPVLDSKKGPPPVTNLIGAPFDAVMNSFATLKRKTYDVDLVFFRGTKEELINLCKDGEGGTEKEKPTITLTVIVNKGSDKEEIRILEAPKGCNVRETLADAGINVYQSITRFTNCKGKQLCGTCIINIKEGSVNTNRKSIDEMSTLRENPDSYRLSCVTFAYDDITVETFPPINAAQWTR